MITRRLFVAPLVAAAVALALPDESRAGLKSIRARFVKETQTGLSLEKEGIQVLSYRFSRPTRGAANLFKPGAGPTIYFSVKNVGPEAKDFSLAAALFDGGGNLVGAASGGKAGKLEPGQAEEVKVVFRDLNENVAHATSIQVSLETHL